MAKPHKILDPKHRPLIAVKLHVLTRKSLGGIQTDLSARALDAAGTPIPGLYAVGEAAGFGGGGVHGYRALEGTFLGGCLFTGRSAGPGRSPARSEASAARAQAQRASVQARRFTSDVAALGREAGPRAGLVHPHLVVAEEPEAERRERRTRGDVLEAGDRRDPTPRQRTRRTICSPTASGTASATSSMPACAPPVEHGGRSVPASAASRRAAARSPPR